MTEATNTSPLALDLTLQDPRLRAALAAARDRAVKEEWADRAIGRRDPMQRPSQALAPAVE